MGLELLLHAGARLPSPSKPGPSIELCGWFLISSSAVKGGVLLGGAPGPHNPPLLQSPSPAGEEAGGGDEEAGVARVLRTRDKGKRERAL